MKNTIFILGASFLLACSSQQEEPEVLPVPTQEKNTQNIEKTQVSAENKAETTLAIEGMVCPSCQHTIQEEVLKMPGVVEVKVSLENKDANIVFDKTVVTPDKIIEKIQTIEDGAYKATLKSEGTEEKSEAENSPEETAANTIKDDVKILSHLTDFEIPNLFTYFIEFIK